MESLIQNFLCFSKELKLQTDPTICTQSMMPQPSAIQPLPFPQYETKPIPSPIYSYGVGPSMNRTTNNNTPTVDAGLAPALAAAMVPLVKPTTPNPQFQMAPIPSVPFNAEGNKLSLHNNVTPTHPQTNPNPIATSQNSGGSDPDDVNRGANFINVVWLKHFEELKRFKELSGHTNVTRTKKESRRLGNWVAEQRRKKKQGRLTRTQVELLSSLGFEWEKRRRSIVKDDELYNQLSIPRSKSSSSSQSHSSNSESSSDSRSSSPMSSPPSSPTMMRQAAFSLSRLM